MRDLATIGVYGSDLDRFLAALRGAGVDLLLDLRQRRGVRGAEYAWANAKRIETELRAAGIVYQHVPELAPTTAMREAQYEADAAKGEGKRSRTVLSAAYAERYTEERTIEPGDDIAAGFDRFRPLGRLAQAHAWHFVEQRFLGRGAGI